MGATAEQFDEMFQYCLGFAEQMLGKAGEFYPFGAVVTPDGQLGARAAWNGEEHPSSQDMYVLQLDAFRAEAREKGLIAVALAVDVNVPQGFESPHPDAVRVKLECANSSRLVYVPYVLKKKGIFGKARTVTFAEPFAVETAHEVFEVAGG